MLQFVLCDQAGPDVCELSLVNPGQHAQAPQHHYVGVLARGFVPRPRREGRRHGGEAVEQPGIHDNVLHDGDPHWARVVGPGPLV